MELWDNKHYLVIKSDIYDQLEEDHGKLPEFILRSQYLPRDMDGILYHNKSMLPGWSDD